jgi:heterodisulfide reductase subunit C
MEGHRNGFLNCLQCGICTSGCPAARFTEYSPREVARRALEGDESLLEDDSLWNCFYCYTCQSRCPAGNSVSVLNQVLRDLQIRSGYGLKHVAMMAEWGEMFYERGMGGTPHVFFAELYEAWGPRWRAFLVHRDELRERLGLGDMFPSEAALGEMRTIMEETGFRARLDSIKSASGQGA